MNILFTYLNLLILETLKASQNHPSTEYKIFVILCLSDLYGWQNALFGQCCLPILSDEQVSLRSVSPTSSFKAFVTLFRVLGFCYHQMFTSPLMKFGQTFLAETLHGRRVVFSQELHSVTSRYFLKIFLINRMLTNPNFFYLVRLEHPGKNANTPHNVS